MNPTTESRRYTQNPKETAAQISCGGPRPSVLITTATEPAPPLEATHRAVKELVYEARKRKAFH